MSGRITIKDVAARAKVSYQTVSKVLNGQAQVSPETETRIWSAVKKLGYVPNHRARDLRTQRSHMLGYSWRPDLPHQINPVMDLFLLSMVEAADVKGYHILPFPHPDPETHVDAYRDLIRTGRVDGFILSSIEYNDPRIKFLQQENFPFVAFGGLDAESDLFVDVDGARGLYFATQHLIAQGHRKIAVLAWPKYSRVGQNRLAGYVKAMREAKLEMRAAWIAHIEGTFDMGYATTKAWLARKNRPTGIVALTDLLAVGAMRAIHESGLRVGADIAVTGFDDTPMAQYLTPSLTSVRQPIREIGQSVIDLLVSSLEQVPLSETQIVLSPELIVRESSV